MLPLGVCYLHKTSTALFSIRIRQYRINTAPNLLQKFELLKKKKEKFAFLLFFLENATRKRTRAQAMSSISLYFFIFSILFFNFALATVRNAPTLNTLQRSCAIKREWGESPRLSRSCEPPLSTGANERTTEAMHLRAKSVGMAGMPYPPIKLFAGCVGMAGMPYPPMLWEGVRVWAASQKTCRNSFADGVIAVRLADWARMTATLTLYK